VTRRPDWIPKRKPFPKAVQAEILKRSGGMCEMPGCGNVGKEFDHYPKPVAFGGESTLENGRLLCRPCNAETGTETAKDAAKADRQGGRSGQYARRQRAGGSRIKSRGFQEKPEGYVSPLSKKSKAYRKKEWK
jgi:5-methylcytosine-specific restriction protein A